MKFSGNFWTLAKLVSATEHLAGAAYQDALHRTEVAIQLQLEKQYDSGTSPGGIGWKNLRTGGRSYLQRSGVMKGATRATRGVKGITVTAPKPAGFHQRGTVKMTQRRIVPDDLSQAPAWTEAVTSACLEALTAGFR